MAEAKKAMAEAKKAIAEQKLKELRRKMDADFDKYLADTIARQKKEPAPEVEETDEEWEERLDKLMRHPAFAKEVDFSKPLHPAMEGLMRLKYEDEDPTARAESFKDDGNEEFKKKKYDVAIDNYTEAIKCECPDRQLNAVLYSNRAAAQYFQGNYRSAMHDCIFARKFNSTHMKAITKGAQCCMEMKRYNEVDRWCSAGLMMEPTNEKLLEMRLKAAKLLKGQERDQRKEDSKDRQEQAKEMKLIREIQSRGIQLAGLKLTDSKIHPSLLTNLEVPNAGNAKVHVDTDNKLVWPVLFMYPEHTQTDYVEAFREDVRFIDHIENMFGAHVEPAPWDTDKKYKQDTIQVYFEDKEKETLYEVDSNATLNQVLSHKRFIVQFGTPSFILLIKGSRCQSNFLKSYKNVKSAS
ncbi:tetratricopeptide repeat protein 4-like [Mizuhopecten yessoensis]|uniref:Tetratricopeptide repeat protein 4 n=1 Tax=Mizuhopecten yessoensis TaxID=6573 RepID=A0A210QYH0_MIZYE|nr:tetratricopeptide repeat protein 4-like [Mizuhopecten yessoensis]XP_021346529.1 tetratricopeptide repeat protein 4-like [Mizuhopecten yessoensis]XP_021346530.1 tetratricopeptide repeat protein 4-like [Mizuhopecten yessoensis]OWF53776.1 Tetratricopeptide repeat protein 4 [Mizuhopecten yessoensis]